MTIRRVVAFGLFCCLICAMKANAQTTNHYWEIRARALNLVFPLDAVPPPYLWKITLRFSDPESQIVVVVRPRGKSEVVRYTLVGMNDEELSQLIRQMLASNSTTTAEEIAAKLKTSVERGPIDRKVLDLAMKKLGVVRISPMLNAICLDKCPEFEYWFDGVEESAHYTILGDFKGAPQGQLVQWMIWFRKKLPELATLTPISKPTPVN